MPEEPRQSIREELEALYQRHSTSDGDSPLHASRARLQTLKEKAKLESPLSQSQARQAAPPSPTGLVDLSSLPSGDPTAPDEGRAESGTLLPGKFDGEPEDEQGRGGQRP